MTGQPKAKQVDRTSAVVGAGMVALLVVGVTTVFADTLAAALSPPPVTGSEAPTRAAEGPATPTLPGGAVVVDGGGSS
jgi:hypothetical protein